jgi:pheromone shutdown protein TraB
LIDRNGRLVRSPGSIVVAFEGPGPGRLDELDLKELMNQDVITAMMQEFGEFAPSAANVLIHERDTYISKKNP